MLASDPEAPSHFLGSIVAVLIAWLVFRGYRQPELLLDIAQMRLC